MGSGSPLALQIPPARPRVLNSEHLESRPTLTTGAHAMLLRVSCPRCIFCELWPATGRRNDWMKEAAWKAGGGSFRTAVAWMLSWSSACLFGPGVKKETADPVGGRRRRFSAAAAGGGVPPVGLEFSPSMGRFQLGQSITRIYDTCLRLSPCIWRRWGGRGGLVRLGLLSFGSSKKIQVPGSLLCCWETGPEKRTE